MTLCAKNFVEFLLDNVFRNISLIIKTQWQKGEIRKKDLLARNVF